MQVIETLTISDISDLRDRVQGGDISAEELRGAIFSILDNPDSLRGELNKMTVKQLSRFSPWGGREKKARLVDSAFNQLVQSLFPSMSFQWSPMSETISEAMRRIAAGITDEQIQEYAESLREKIDKRDKALNNPETLGEFRQHISMLGDSDSLSSGQLAEWDRLEAESSRTLRRERRQETTVERFTGSAGDVEFFLKEGYHEKKDCPLYVVGWEGKVPREDYLELKVKAKQLGGWYSSFKKDFTGFQFYDRGSAEKFVSLSQGDVDRSDELEARKARKEQTAGERLRELADNMEAEANAKLNAPRQVNTSRRARMAAHAEADARQEIKDARTLRNIAAELDSGRAQFLDGVRYATDFDELVGALYQGQRNRERVDIKRIPEELTGYERNKAERDIYDRPLSEADVDYVRYPFPTIYARHVYELGCFLKGVKGAKRIGSAMEKEGKAAIDREQAEQSRVGDGFRANPGYVEFRDETSIRNFINAYETAKSKGWRNDIVESEVMEWKRFQRMDIHTVHELRAALRELFPLLSDGPKADPVTILERDLIGVPIPGFFATPDDIAAKVVECADIRDGMTVLEPSAGKGDLADAALNAADCAVTCIEVDSRLRKILEAKGHDLAQRQDFMSDEGSVATEFYDRVVMNPPFEAGQGIEHVRRAYTMLREGGRLVAIMSAGPFFRSDRKSEEFRDWLDGVGGTVEDLPEDAFNRPNAFRRTGVQTKLVVIDK